MRCSYVFLHQQKNNTNHLSAIAKAMNSAQIDKVNLDGVLIGYSLNKSLTIIFFLGIFVPE